MLKARLRTHKTVGSAFTLIELMIVVVIVAILATAAIPLYTGLTRDAEWAEAIAGAGQIHSACRTRIGRAGDLTGVSDYTDVGVETTDLDGKYFENDDYDLTVDDADEGEYTITVTHPDDATQTYIIDETGTESGTYTTGG